jgi:hypothetical protein
VEWEYTRGGFCEGQSLSTVESIPVGEKRGECMVMVLEFGLVDATVGVEWREVSRSCPLRLVRVDVRRVRGGGEKEEES